MLKINIFYLKLSIDLIKVTKYLVLAGYFIRIPLIDDYYEDNYNIIANNNS
jgi:hypothetical protein